MAVRCAATRGVAVCTTARLVHFYQKLNAHLLVALQFWLMPCKLLHWQLEALQALNDLLAYALITHMIVQMHTEILAAVAKFNKTIGAYIAMRPRTYCAHLAPCHRFCMQQLFAAKHNLCRAESVLKSKGIQRGKQHIKSNHDIYWRKTWLYL